jgi:hypothetical protein
MVEVAAQIASLRLGMLTTILVVILSALVELIVGDSFQTVSFLA